MSGEIKKILVMGAGVMGATMAQVYAAGGYETVVADTAPEALERARKRIQANLEGMEKDGLLTIQYKENVEKNLSTALSTDVIPVAKSFDLVAEAVFENPDVKRSVFQMLSDHCRPDCIFASNTSAMDVFSVTEDIVKNPERVLIGHWFQPPHLMKLVEVVRGPKTSDDVVEKFCEVLSACGRKPAVINKYIPGFIVNRIACLVGRELFYMLDQGWAKPEDLETALRYTDGLRWGFEGPLGLFDVVGHPLSCAIMDAITPSLCSEPYYTERLQKLADEGKNGVRAGEGVLGKYPKDTEAWFARRNQRIVTMVKMLDEFERQDREEPIE